jgi:hypothetical protein
VRAKEHGMTSGTASIARLALFSFFVVVAAGVTGFAVHALMK